MREERGRRVWDRDGRGRVEQEVGVVASVERISGVLLRV